jgi:hypothetical protein
VIEEANDPLEGATDLVSFFIRQCVQLKGNLRYVRYVHRASVLDE